MGNLSEPATTKQNRSAMSGFLTARIHACLLALIAGAAGPAGSQATAAAPAIGSEVRLSANIGGLAPSFQSPVIAYSGFTREHTVAWDGSIYGGVFLNQVDESGRTLASQFPELPFVVSTEGYSPALAYGEGGTFLIVWAEDPAGSPDALEIWGRECARYLAGLTCKPKVLVFKWANRSVHSPRVAWDSIRARWFVVWSARDTVTGNETDVAGVLVGPGGTIISPAPVIIHDITRPSDVDLVYNWLTDQYAVVWQERYSATDSDLRGKLLNAKTMTAAGLIEVDVSSRFDYRPRIATNLNEYLVAWNTQTSPAIAEVGYRRFDTKGVPLAPRVHLDAFPTDDARTPAATYLLGAPGRFMVTWTTNVGSESHVTGVLVTPGSSTRFNWVQGPNVARWGPALAADEAGGALVAYPAAPFSALTSSHIYGRTWRAAAFAVPGAFK